MISQNNYTSIAFAASATSAASLSIAQSNSATSRAYALSLTNSIFIYEIILPQLCPPLYLGSTASHLNKEASLAHLWAL